MPRFAEGAAIGRYRIEAFLGAGGMAEIYRATDTALDIPIALKRLPPPVSHNGLGVRFEREARAIARLDHPGCIRVFDCGRADDGSRFLTMQLLDGPTLRARMDRLGRFSAEHAVALARELLDALGHAHNAGILHRDLKPANIMFATRSGSERAVLIDFGLARAAGQASITARGTCVGSPSYVAPERIAEQPCDERSDLYSLGVVLYELLAGRRPFEGPTQLDTLSMHLSSKPPPLPPDVPRALADVVERALAKEPDLRYPTAAAFARALAR